MACHTDQMREAVAGFDLAPSGLGVVGTLPIVRTDDGVDLTATMDAVPPGRSGDLPTSEPTSASSPTPMSPTTIWPKWSPPSAPPSAARCRQSTQAATIS